MKSRGPKYKAQRVCSTTDSSSKVLSLAYFRATRALRKKEKEKSMTGTQSTQQYSTYYNRYIYREDSLRQVQYLLKINAKT